MSRRKGDVGKRVWVDRRRCDRCSLWHSTERSKFPGICWYCVLALQKPQPVIEALDPDLKKTDPIDRLAISGRARGALYMAGIETVEGLLNLVQAERVRKERGCGHKTITEIAAVRNQLRDKFGVSGQNESQSPEPKDGVPIEVKRVPVWHQNGRYHFWTYHPSVSALVTYDPALENDGEPPARYTVNAPHARSLSAKYEAYATQEEAIQAGTKAAKSMQVPCLQDLSSQSSDPRKPRAIVRGLFVGVQKFPSWIQVLEVIERVPGFFLRVHVQVQHGLLAPEPHSHDVVLKWDHLMNNNDPDSRVLRPDLALRPLPDWAAPAAQYALFEERKRLEESCNRSVHAGRTSKVEPCPIVISEAGAYEPKSGMK